MLCLKKICASSCSICPDECPVKMYILSPIIALSLSLVVAVLGERTAARSRLSRHYLCVSGGIHSAAVESYV